MQWIRDHWETIATVAGVVAVVASTILVRVLDWYGAACPRLRQALGFVLSLLALVPVRGGVSKGVRIAVGAREVQVPLLSWSEGEAEDHIARRVREIREARK